MAQVCGAKVDETTGSRWLKWLLKDICKLPLYKCQERLCDDESREGSVKMGAEARERERERGRDQHVRERESTKHKSQ